MNPITLPIAELRPALTGLGKIINPKSNLPVLQCVKIERTAEGWIALTTTDLERFVTMRLEQPAEGQPVSMLIPYDQLLQISKNCDKNEQVHLEPTPQGTLIKFALTDKIGESKVKLIAVAEFPPTPKINSAPIPLPPELRRSILEAMACASIDGTRYILNGTFIDTSNPKANHIVATDGKHLYSSNSFALPLKNSLIIPNHKFLGWKEFNLDGEWQMKADEKIVQLSSRRWRFITRQIQGKYPDWRNSIPNPTDAKTNITLDPAKLEALIKLIHRLPCHDDRYHSIGLEWKRGQFTLLAKETNDEPWLRIPVPDNKGEGPELTIFLDRHILIKALQYGLNTISLIAEMSPLRFHSKGRQMIVMPLRPDAATSQHRNQAPAPRPSSRPVPPPPTTTMTPPQNPTEEPVTAPKIDDILEGLQEVQRFFVGGLNKLRDVSVKLKQVHRGQRHSEKEMQSVRSTLLSLQRMRL